jgi:hypothetical protein
MERTEVDEMENGAVSASPGEPFPCPVCGQMLAASCRVCVACKTPVDVTQIRKAQPEPSFTPLETSAPPAMGPVRFSWRIFFLWLLIYLSAAILTTRLLGEQGGKYAMGGFVLVSSMWVFFDAQRRGVPKPLRWVLGALLLWIVVFPWYLARRRTPLAPCPFIEAQAGPVARLLFVILVAFFLIGALLIIFQGPPAK